MTHSERTARFAQISTLLALQSERQLTRLVDEAKQLASGIGGITLAFEIEGLKVFAKRLRLTDLERRPEYRMSTQNIFELPTYCQRNVGSVGFGVWRELAANAMTTGWVLSQQLDSFPLSYLHHNGSLDRGYVLAKWVNWLIKAFAPKASSCKSEWNWFEPPHKDKHCTSSSLTCRLASPRSSVDMRRSPQSSTTSTSSCTAKAEAHATRAKMSKPCCGHQLGSRGMSRGRIVGQESI